VGYPAKRLRRDRLKSLILAVVALKRWRKEHKRRKQEKFYAKQEAYLRETEAFLATNRPREEPGSSRAARY
jgi:hypothetical protein